MILSILSIKDDISNDDNDENTDEVELLSSSDINRSVQQLKFPAKAKQIVSNRIGYSLKMPKKKHRIKLSNLYHIKMKN